MKRIDFSTRVAIVYTLIIAVPVLLMIMGVSEYLRSSVFDSVINDSVRAAADNRKTVELSVEQIERLESVITSDYELMRTFYFAEQADEGQIIETLRVDMKNIERLQFAMPSISGIRIFLDNKYVPERWPIVFFESRMDFHKLGRWTWNFRESIMANLKKDKIPQACLTREILLNKRHVGFLQIMMNMEVFFPFVYSEKDSFTEDYVFSGGESLGPESVTADAVRVLMAKQPREAETGNFIARVGGSTCAVSWERIDRLGILMVHTRSLSVITKSIFAIRLCSVLLILISIATFFMLIKFATKKMFARIYSVMRGMSEIRKGNLEASVDVSGDDEVADMARAFTAMVDRIRTLISETEEKQALVAHTEIRAMQNQINAHFIYNVLETIKMQAEIADEAEIAESVTLLGRMMRYCLKWRNHKVTLAQEMNYIRDYVSLMNIRNDYYISLIVAVDGRFLEREIPKMLIQPVVENAVLHAIEPQGEDSVVEISASVDAEKRRLVLSVRDSGCGMDGESLRALLARLDRCEESGNSVGGIGLVNIQQRLKAFYGSDYSIDISSAPGFGTEVLIPIPLEESNQLSFEENPC